MAFGRFDCDETAKVPDIYAADYAERLAGVCRDHGVDLLIPTHDDETLLLAKAARLFESTGTKLLAAEPALLELCRDKLFEGLPENVGKHFVASRTIEEFKAALAEGKAALPAIAKPRKGFASRGVQVLLDEDDLQRAPFGSVVQEIAAPGADDPNREEFNRLLASGQNPQISEISLQFVFDRSGRLAGRMATVNRLTYGVPVEIVPVDSEEIWEPANEVAGHLGKLSCRGPVNLQGRLTDEGLKLFELNARFTGISAIRAMMGFNEVEYCIADWLDIPNRPRTLVSSASKIGVRQIADRVVPASSVEKASPIADKESNRIVLVTGGTGYLGRQILVLLSEEEGTDTWVFTRDREAADTSAVPKGCEVFDLADLRSGKLPLGMVDALVHSAFARPFKGAAEIAASLKFTFELFDLAAAAGVHRIINISSQSVYGAAPTPWRETDAPAPVTPYGQAKLASELYLGRLKRTNASLETVSLRVCSITGGTKGLVPNEVTAVLVRRVIDGEQITIQGGDQMFERIDVRDAARAVCAVLKLPPYSIPAVLNIGTGAPVKLLDLASVVVEHGSKRGLVENGAFALEPANEELTQELCVKRLRDVAGWRPRFTLADTVKSLYDHLEDGG
ncbi:MAG TPA: NAD-dependent epimerase/dehydratase family protein [Aridibacter sp.]|nr:NAD-dependent epimerase/dehydratase family protein [Aridibacter sp.]